MTRSPSDTLVFARNMAADMPVCLTLLYVLNLNIVVPGRRIYDELCAESEVALHRLAWLFFGTDQAARIVVRIGAPHEEILKEAKSDGATLSSSPAPNPARGSGCCIWAPPKRILEASPCPAVVLPRSEKAVPHWLTVPVAVNVAASEAVLPAA